MLVKQIGSLLTEKHILCNQIPDVNSKRSKGTRSLTHPKNRAFCSPTFEIVFQTGQSIQSIHGSQVGVWMQEAAVTLRVLETLPLGRHEQVTDVGVVYTPETIRALG